jgi:hypothetical protein
MNLVWTDLETSCTGNATGSRNEYRGYPPVAESRSVAEPLEVAIFQQSS